MPEVLKTDCRFFRGERPCIPHKEHGVHCTECQFYDRIGERILIIKLGAAGDVIRSTPLLRKLKQNYPHSFITWLTDHVAFLPTQVDEKLKYSDRILPWLSLRRFDLCINLDKDRESIAVAEMIMSPRKFGFGIDGYGRPRAMNQLAEAKLLTGVFDDVSKKNKKSYVQEIFEICGFEFRDEEYIVQYHSERKWEFEGKHPIVGLNTGCGGRWPSRLWPVAYWCDLAKRLRDSGVEVILLGGPEEVERNEEIHRIAGGKYFGVLPIQDFIGLVDQCDVVVTQVTMTLHLALGLKKKVVLLNNIFNKNEFEMYGLGIILEPERPCGCYYSPDCPHESMKSISPQNVFVAIRNFV